MRRLTSLTLCVLVSLLCATFAAAQSKADLIRSAESAAPDLISKNATIKDAEGNVLRQGTNGWTCYPENPSIGAMCNQPQWDKLMAAMMAKEPIKVEELSISYMLAGEGDAPGVSNKDPYATAPTSDNDWIKEGPHLMITVPDPAMLEGMSTNPKDPVYVMWKGTPYAHIMVKIKGH